jgi:hypothetical protein
MRGRFWLASCHRRWNIRPSSRKDSSELSIAKVKTVKVVSKAACDPVIIPKAGHVLYNVENLPTRRKARPEILMRLSD